METPCASIGQDRRFTLHRVSSGLYVAPHIRAAFPDVYLGNHLLRSSAASSPRISASLQTNCKQVSMMFPPRAECGSETIQPRASARRVHNVPFQLLVLSQLELLTSRLLSLELIDSCQLLHQRPPLLVVRTERSGSSCGGGCSGCLFLQSRSSSRSLSLACARR